MPDLSKAFLAPYQHKTHKEFLEKIFDSEGFREYRFFFFFTFTYKSIFVCKRKTGPLHIIFPLWSNSVKVAASVSNTADSLLLRNAFNATSPTCSCFISVMKNALRACCNLVSPSFCLMDPCQWATHLKRTVTVAMQYNT